MFSFTHRIVLTLLFITCVGGPGSVAIAQDLPAAPKRQYTQKEYYADLLKMQRRDLVEGYKKYGRHNVKWDRQMLEFLEGLSRAFTAEMAPQRWKPAHPQADELVRQAKALIDAGCDDPLVTYGLLSAREDQGNAETDIQVILKHAKEMEASKYGALRKDVAWLRACNAIPPSDPKLLAETQQHERTIRAEAIFGPAPDAITRRFRLAAYKVRDWNVKTLAQTLEGVKTVKNPDPWMVHMVRGRHEITAAWEDRGGGWASTVTEKGREGFRKHLDEAASQLTAAYRLAPDCPESAAAMITVSMGGGDPAHTSRQWLDRAAAAQFDYMDAYGAYLNDIMPRWHGSLEAMLQFGIECANTKRFDTEVPEVFLDAIRMMRVEMPQPDAIYQTEGVYDAMTVLFDGLCAEPSRKAEADKLRSRQAGLAWKCGRAAEAKKLLDALGDRVDNGGMIAAGTSAAQAVPAIYAATCEQATFIVAADALLNTHHTEDAIGRYQSVMGKLGDSSGDKQVKIYLARHIRLAEWAGQLDKTGEVDVSPDKDLTGWTVMRGEWKVENGEVFGTSDDTGMLMLLELPVGQLWAFSGEVGIGFNRSNMGADNAIIYHSYYLYAPHSNSWDIETNAPMKLAPDQTPPDPFPSIVVFNMMRWNHATAMRFGDGKMWAMKIDPTIREANPPLGIGGYYLDRPGYALRFRQLKLKRLPDAEPGWVKSAR